MGKLDHTYGEVIVQPSRSMKGLLSPYAMTNQRVADVPILLQSVSAHRVILQKTMFLEQQHRLRMMNIILHMPT